MKPTTANLIYVWLGASLLLALFLGALAAMDVDRVAAVEANEVYSDAVMLQAANDLQREVSVAYLDLRAAAFGNRPPDRAQLETTDRAIERAYQALAQMHPDKEEQALLNRIEPGLAKFRHRARLALLPYQLPGSGALTESVVALQPALDALVAKQHRDLELQHEVVAATSRRLRGELLGIVGVGLPFLAALAFFVIRRVVRPLQALEEASQLIGAGKPGVRVQAAGQDEFGQVARAFNEMAEHVEVARIRLEDANAELVALDRYKDEFLGILSHELRTPLNFITGFTSILADEVIGPLSPEQQRVVDRIDRGAARMLTLVDELLVFSAWRNGRLALRREVEDVGALVAEALDVLAEDARDKRIQVETDVDCEIDEVFDAALIKQALVHLVANAIKFTPAGGRVDVRARCSSDGLCVEVSDTGVGIAEADLPRLFGIFQQLDMSPTRAGGGVGLGLGLAKAIVEAHGGTIGVKSQVGCGSTFWFHLPRQRVAAQASV
ncbi:MAG: sensor hybrid histidine kinase [Cyanobacteria bacterium RYN_339]|nr:sensor hybrid histidine kinase [Cyanobacteria bacterium RYN_339]